MNGGAGPLTQLILDVRERTGMTYSELSRKARKAGYPISRAQLNNYVLEAASMPPERMVLGLAAALDLSPEVVLEAALAQYYSGYRKPEVIQLPADATEEEIAAVRAIVEVLRKRQASS